MGVVVSSTRVAAAPVVGPVQVEAGGVALSGSGELHLPRGIDAQAPQGGPGQGGGGVERMS